MPRPTSIRVTWVALGPPEPAGDDVECPQCFRSVLAQPVGVSVNAHPSNVTTLLICEPCGLGWEKPKSTTT